ncbi:MAG: AmmeMemoRadiSam system radical SAM enzyme [Chloroflexia bacterium]|nr:AmmeMemoRadiSam system radical SAM enzyme [Chloroflexia bacterium]
MEDLQLYPQALCWRPEADEGAVCTVCQRYCRLSPGEVGFCRTKINRDGVIYDLTYALVAFASADPIEKKPIFHFQPGARVLSLGGLGCNFRCRFCQNWRYAFADGSKACGPEQPRLSPQQAISLAQEQSCQGIAWTYNEPSIWINYVHDCAVLAKSAGLFTILVTNGYISLEALERIAPYLDVYQADIKSFSPDFYHRLCNEVSLSGVLRTIEKARDYGMHLEITTPFVPHWNDEIGQLEQIARWIKEHLGRHTPWHLLPFEPKAYMLSQPRTPVSLLQSVIEKAHEIGLDYVYAAIEAGLPEFIQTHCPQCGRAVVLRDTAYQIEVKSLQGDCPGCGDTVYMV